MVTQRPDGLVEFRFLRPDAHQALLAGSFTGWQKSPIPMLKDEHGWWYAHVNLPEGEHQFRYQADGEWFCDHAAFGLEMTTLGWNSVARVESPAAIEEQPEAERVAA